MIDYSGPERRRFVRVPFIFPVKYVLADDKDKKEYHSLSDNLSEGGIKIICMQKIDEGTDIRLDFSLPTSDGIIEIKCLGRIAWYREKDNKIYCGVQFVDLDSDKHKLLQNFIFKILEYRGVETG